MSTPVRVVALVSGEVQGVGFRWFVRQQATSRGLVGSATNLADGRVEVVLQGPPADVDAVVAELTGPHAPGRPATVDVRDDVVRAVRDFTVA